MEYTRIFLTAPVLVAVLTMIGATAPNVYARHLSDSQRYNDGYSNGSDAAARDSTYNVACDPSGAYTSDGQHSTTYCDGWANGYTATWNSNHGSYTGPTGPSYPQPQHSLTDQICTAYHNGSVGALAALLAPLHLISGGTTALILAAGGAYCLAH